MKFFNSRILCFYAPFFHFYILTRRSFLRGDDSIVLGFQCVNQCPGFLVVIVVVPHYCVILSTTYKIPVIQWWRAQRSRSLYRPIYSYDVSARTDELITKVVVLLDLLESNILRVVGLLLYKVWKDTMKIQSLPRCNINGRKYIIIINRRI